ncbi:IucA/IucC family protein [Candidatus Nitrotoga sp. M5]|uniref:IucA/IucC family protein n=1 Tax=Candidatus Nitrotoga sp. M5 TaxID=2890409 RepID=UPI001EF253D3|nr:IucA/IucC family protein [Candidatus Nitrotoga sp. M5]CAH1386616.1 Siderophore synthetase component [Candidatus Nitrotoga sp. M5]
MSPHLPRITPIERRLVEQYLNTYCRETSCFDPRLAPSEPGPIELRAHIEIWRAAGLMPYRVSFGQTGYQLAGALAYFSPIGYHRVAPFAWIGRRSDWQPLTDDVMPFVDLITDSLATANSLPVDVANQCRDHLKTLMRNSVDKVRRFHRYQPIGGRSLFLSAEQGMRFGHIFHVTSKASDGFSEEDMQRYAPELGASFRLHYFAVATGLLDTRAVDREALPIDPEALLFAKDLLAGGDYQLLPCHPWQANYLLNIPEINVLVKDRSLISLGPLGEVAWPTSSVRTVWLPGQDLFLKLSLNIRITNFVRNNPPEQVERALDASLALSLLPQDVLEQPAFHILPELGSQTLKLSSNALRAACAVVYRKAMPIAEAEHVQVVASVLEEPAEGEIPLLNLLRQTAVEGELDGALIRRWWARYLEASLLPLLRLFSKYGISLEAHLQNTMMAFRNGWPVRGYSRDMEGASISRTRYPFLDRLPPDSPALYDEQQAWHRFQYYVLVNHVGHVIACLARTGLTTETTLWQDTAEQLDATGNPLAQQLLKQPTLPAKANMLSSFHRHGEHPIWVEIPNPMLIQR